MNPLIVIVGPTAVGKTKIGVEIASQINSQIVSGDSMQIYKFMDIGTAKISENEMYGQNGIKVKHHMIDIVSPLESYSVADFQKDARKCIKKIHINKAIPILLGGTGLYVRAVIDDYEFQDEIDTKIRAELLEQSKEIGLHYLYRQLTKIDPKTASKIHANDMKRIIRALEFYKVTGKPISQHNKAYNYKSIYDPLIMIGLYLPRDILYKRINMRVDKMIEDGLIDEVKSLIAGEAKNRLLPMLMWC
jgi:tRNA dimethylallyltransferase